MQIIVEKMIDYLRGVTDDVAKADVVNRIGDLAERYAPDTQWFIDTMNQVNLLSYFARCRGRHDVRQLSCGVALHLFESAPVQPIVCLHSR